MLKWSSPQPISSGSPLCVLLCSAALVNRIARVPSSCSRVPSSCSRRQLEARSVRRNRIARRHGPRDEWVGRGSSRPVTSSVVGFCTGLTGWTHTEQKALSLRCQSQKKRGRPAQLTKLLSTTAQAPCGAMSRSVQVL